MNGGYYQGPVIVFPKHIMMWNVNKVEDITIESLSPIALLWPKIRKFTYVRKLISGLLFVGTGSKLVQISPEIREHFRAKGIIIEVQSTRNALATFNFCNSEDRDAAVALLQHE